MFSCTGGQTKCFDSPSLRLGCEPIIEFVLDDGQAYSVERVYYPYIPRIPINYWQDAIDGVVRSDTDIVLLTLNKDVPGTKAVEVASEVDVLASINLVSIGYPEEMNKRFGLPAKIASRCSMLDWYLPTAILTDCLAHSGQSGGPVFLRVGKIWKLVGIKVSSNTQTEFPETAVVLLSKYPGIVDLIK